VITCAPIAELRLIMEKDRIIMITKLLMLVEGIATQASPMMSDPKFGSKNSALKTMLSDFFYCKHRIVHKYE
jgi:hypothetical protein